MNRLHWLCEAKLVPNEDFDNSTLFLFRRKNSVLFGFQTSDCILSITVLNLKKKTEDKKIYLLFIRLYNNQFCFFR